MSSGFLQLLLYVLPTALTKAWRDFSWKSTNSHWVGHSLRRTSFAQHFFVRRMYMPHMLLLSSVGTSG